MKNVVLFLLIYFALNTYCTQVYKAGNLVSLSYPVKTTLRTTIVQQYIDSLILRHGYDVPDKWSHLDKLIDIDSVNHRRVYFSNSPEEMYLISFQGQLILSDVYNEKIRSNDWVSRRDSMPAKEELRIKKRFETEILDVVKTMAHKSGRTDSLIYKNK